MVLSVGTVSVFYVWWSILTSVLYLHGLRKLKIVEEWHRFSSWGYSSNIALHVSFSQGWVGGEKNAKEKDEVNKLLAVFHILIPNKYLTASQPLTCCSDMVLCAL
jgi:hypothetical protein